MCLLTHERYNTYQTGFSFGRLGHAQEVGLGGTVGGLGGQIFLFFFEIWNSTRFGVWVTYMNGTCTGTIFGSWPPWGLGEGPKGQISLNLNYKVNFKGFSTKLCVSSHKWKIYNISDGIFIRRLGHAHGGWDLGGKFFSPKLSQIWCVS